MTNETDPNETPQSARSWRDRWPFRLFFATQSSDETASRNLAEQFRRSLLTDLRAMPRPGDTAPEHVLLYDQALSLLTNTDSMWPDIYEAQKIIAHLTPDGALNAALEREIIEADGLKIDTTQTRQRIRMAAPDGPDAEEKRAYLGILVSDVQWERKKRFARRTLRACYVERVCYLTFLVGSIFLGGLIWTVYANDPKHDLFAFVSENLRYPGLIIAIASGILGAWFSMLVSIDKRLSGLTLDELRVAQHITSLAGRLIFGAASAVIFYFLLQSGLFSAEILPNISEIGFEQKNLPTNNEPSLRDLAISGEIDSATASWLPKADLCLLIVWGVLCGFSEKLVPAALTRHAETGSGGG